MEPDIKHMDSTADSYNYDNQSKISTVLNKFILLRDNFKNNTLESYCVGRESEKELLLN